MTEKEHRLQSLGKRVLRFGRSAGKGITREGGERGHAKGGALEIHPNVFEGLYRSCRTRHRRVVQDVRRREASIAEGGKSPGRRTSSGAMGLSKSSPDLCARGCVGGECIFGGKFGEVSRSRAEAWAGEKHVSIDRARLARYQGHKTRSFKGG